MGFPHASLPQSAGTKKEGEGTGAVQIGANVTAKITSLSDNIGVITIDDMGNIQSSNAFISRIFGYPGDQLRCGFERSHGACPALRQRMVPSLAHDTAPQSVNTSPHFLLQHDEYCGLDAEVRLPPPCVRMAGLSVSIAGAQPPGFVVHHL